METGISSSFHPISVVETDILDVRADYLISSGNPWLNMSGGVNGALFLRYGQALQDELHTHLRGTGKEFVPPGYCYKFKQSIGAYKGDVYCVAIDGLYDSSKELLKSTILSGLQALSPRGLETVVLPALATGYGKLTKAEFGSVLKELGPQLATCYQGTRFIVAERKSYEVDEIKLAAGIIN